MEITLALSILASVISVSSFALNRKDKALLEQKDNHQELIQYQLKELQEDVKAILLKLDKYDEDIDARIEAAISLHIRLYHDMKREEKREEKK